MEVSGQLHAATDDKQKNPCFLQSSNPVTLQTKLPHSIHIRMYTVMLE